MNILLVDDEELQLIRLKKVVENVLPGHLLFAFDNPLTALQEVMNRKFDLAFLDIEMPGMDGLMLARKLKAAEPSTKIIFVTAYDHYALEAFKTHASGYLSKPVNEEKVRKEIEELSHAISLEPAKKIQVKCFGNFEVFHNGEPLKFKRSKSKELFAYLIDREGAAISVSELNAILWEEDHSSYLRNLISDIQQTLKAIDCEDVFVKRHNECFVDISKVDCDAYKLKATDPEAARLYRGEYMCQYPWAMFDQGLNR